jgi:hypothetical protein
MNKVITTLKAQLESNATDLAAEEQYLADVTKAIAEGVDVIAIPSKILARIEYFKGREYGLKTALYAIEREAQVNA